MQMVTQTAVPLNILSKDRKATISHFTDDLLATKMISIGVLPGSEVRIMQVAPLGGGMYLKVNNFKVAIRQAEASKIFVTTSS
jgi:ferrous iron transport protein A